MKEKKNQGTYDFARTEIGPSPRGGIGGAAVEAPSADPVGEFCGGIIRMDDGHGRLTRDGILTVVVAQVLLGHGWWSVVGRQGRWGGVRRLTRVVVLVFVAGMLLKGRMGRIEVGTPWMTYNLCTGGVVLVGMMPGRLDHWRIVLVGCGIHGRRLHRMLRR